MLCRALFGLALLATGAPAPAHAQPGYPEMDFEPVTVLRDARGRVAAYELCATGDAAFLNLTAAWDFRMDGTRASATGVPGPAVAERDGETGDPWYEGCLVASRLGYPTGHVHATFSYNGIGGNTPYTIEHTFTWCEGCPNPRFAVDVEEGLETEVDPV